MMLIAALLPIGFENGLNIATIKKVFNAVLNEQKEAYELREIRWQVGSFTDSKALEALVSFYDDNQCHAAGWSELWLLHFDNGWKLDRKLEDSDWISFKAIDIDGDGKLEVWVESGGGNQGYFVSRGKLLFLSKLDTKVLYLNEGFDYTSAMKTGLASLSHKVTFQDIDNDGILELLDWEEKGYYRWLGKEWASEYAKVSAQGKLIIAKLDPKTGKFHALDYLDNEAMMVDMTSPQ